MADEERFTCPPDHPHDDSARCFTHHKCRCDDCLAENRVRGAAWRARRKSGTVEPRIHDLEAVREHVGMLRTRGMTVRAIADAAGLGFATVSGVDRHKFMYEFAVAAILGVRYAAPTPKPMRAVDATGTKRRLHGLVALGWTSEELSHRLGKDKRFISTVERGTYVFESTRDAVKRLYDELWDVIPPDSIPSRRAISRARRNGWVVPLMWDDDEIDNPDAVPGGTPRGDDEDEPPMLIDRLDEIRIQEAISGTRPELSPAERRVVVTRLHHERWSAARIGAHIGCSARTVNRIRVELGLECVDQNDLVDAA